MVPSNSIAAAVQPPRRLALVDLTLPEFRHLPELLHRPGISVGLLVFPPESMVASEVISDIPYTRDLEELVRQDFDLALVGAASTRRAQIEQILTARGTPVQLLEDFLASEIVWERIDALQRVQSYLKSEPGKSGAFHAGHDPHRAPARETEESARASAPPPRAASPPEVMGAHPEAPAETDEELVGEMPLPSDPAALELALARWVQLFGATSAELHGGDADYIEWVCRSGDEDPLLKCIISLALEHDAPQVVSMLDGFQRGRIFAAWPFRAGFRRGVLAAGGLDPRRGRGQWERVAHGLAETWERHDRERAAPSFPMVPGTHGGWLSVAAFRHRLSLAVERNRRDELRFEAHRIILDGPPACIEAMLQTLPQKMRGTDCVCQPSPHSMLLLVAGPASAAVHIRNRLATVWQESWQTHGGTAPTRPLSIERVELDKPGDAAGFMAATTAWLSAS